ASLVGAHSPTPVAVLGHEVRVGPVCQTWVPPYRPSAPHDVDRLKVFYERHHMRGSDQREAHSALAGLTFNLEEIGPNLSHWLKVYLRPAVFDPRRDRSRIRLDFQSIRRRCSELDCKTRCAECRVAAEVCTRPISVEVDEANCSRPRRFQKDDS